MLGRMFNMFKIRYETLDKILTDGGPTFNTKRHVNLFINMDCIYTQLFSKNLEEYIRARRTNDKMYDPISNIINVAAHYREFFTRHHIYTRVILYSADYESVTELQNKSYCSEYRYKYREILETPGFSFMKRMLINGIPIAKTILEYAEGVHYITSKELEPACIPLVVSGYFDADDMNILITKDQYEYQYVNHGFTILRPKKQDGSYCINKDNLIEKIKFERNSDGPGTVNPEYYSLVYSLLGDGLRSLPKFRGYGLQKIFRLINDNIKAGLLSPNGASIQQFVNILPDDMHSQIVTNFYCTDLDTQIEFPSNFELLHLSNQLTNKFDNASLREINDQYFVNYPIYLEELTRAANLLKTYEEYSKPKLNLFKP